MIRLIYGVFPLAFLVFGCAAPLHGDGGDLSKLRWMAGSWAEVGDTANARSEEHWTVEAGDTMLGMNRQVSGGRTVAFEYLRIVRHPDGVVVYYASPGGRNPPTGFRLVYLEPGRAVFDNPGNDYPQRITYWRDGDMLHARIEGYRGGQRASDEWAWSRVRQHVD